MAIKEQFKAALADILWSDEVEKIILASKKRDRKRIAAFAEAVKKGCDGSGDNIGRLPIILLLHDMPGETLWQSVLFRMIENECREERGEE